MNFHFFNLGSPFTVDKQKQSFFKMFVAAISRLKLSETRRNKLNLKVDDTSIVTIYIQGYKPQIFCRLRF